MWPYNDLVKAWCNFGPLLSKTLAAISNESNGDWASCIRFCCVCLQYSYCVKKRVTQCVRARPLQYDRDPRRIQWLCDIVLQLPDLKAQDLSTAAEGRALSYYQILIGELSWRGCEPSAALLEHIRQHIDHPYKLVRERMARSVAFCAAWLHQICVIFLGLLTSKIVFVPRGLYAVFRNFWSPLDMQTAPGPDEVWSGIFDVSWIGLAHLFMVLCKVPLIYCHLRAIIQKRNEREAFVVEVMEKAMAVGEEGSSEQEAWKLCSKTGNGDSEIIVHVALSRIFCGVTNVSGRTPPCSAQLVDDHLP
jgi:hypothetical protein